MVNTSINLASLAGLLLILWSIPSAIMGGMQIFFILQRRSDTSPAVLAKTFLLIFQALGRLVALPICGIILFLHGWRLDPILQFSVNLLVAGIVIESISGIVKDYQRWRSRTGRAIASITVETQPGDEDGGNVNPIKRKPIKYGENQ